jgi:hypothetical protein
VPHITRFWAASVFIQIQPMSAPNGVPTSAYSRIGLGVNRANVSDRSTGRAGVSAVHVSVDRFAAQITGRLIGLARS